MLIGELAARAGVTPKTLRFYEHAGVLPPPARTLNGDRNYGEDALDRLTFMRSAQAAGLTLAEIRDVIALRDQGSAPCAHVGELLDQKAQAVSKQIADLRALKSELDRLSHPAHATDPATCDPRSPSAPPVGGERQLRRRSLHTRPAGHNPAQYKGRRAPRSIRRGRSPPPAVAKAPQSHAHSPPPRVQQTPPTPRPSPSPVRPYRPLSDGGKCPLSRALERTTEFEPATLTLAMKP